jgi:hypothetical protein
MWRVGNWVIERARDRDAALGQAYLEGHEEGTRLGVKMADDLPPGDPGTIRLVGESDEEYEARKRRFLG